jgi:TonB family protein
LLFPVAAPLLSLLPALRAELPSDFRFSTSLGAGPASSGLDWADLVVTIYLFSCAFAAFRLCWRWTRLRSLNENNISVPTALGIAHPRILLPAHFRLEASPLALEAAVAHEQAHLQRGDFARNLALEIVTLPLAFHPALWYMKTRLAQARELACDALAARTLGRRRYAQGLIEAAGALAAASPERTPRLAPGMLDHTDFEERIMHLNRSALPLRRGYLVLAAMLVAAPSMSLFGFYFQNEEKVYQVGGEVSSPRVLHKENPEYPQELQDSGVAGTVVLGVEITRAGLAEKITVKRSAHPALDASAVESLGIWRFEPGRFKGEPVRVAATIEVNFRVQ